MSCLTGTWMTSHSASQIKAMEGGDGMTRNLRMTGAVAASDAARVLGDPNATGAERSAAASALAQVAHQARQTRAQAASDARYGWAAKCLVQFGSAPRQILNERNTVAHVTEYEGPAAPAPADL
jgi:vancomycin resistance protein YoaR